jgi:SM-20-related protein
MGREAHMGSAGFRLASGGGGNSVTTLHEEFPGAFQKLVDGIQRSGWFVLPDFLGEGVAGELSTESRAAWEEGEFRRAGVGRGKDMVIREDVRTDHVMWLRDEDITTCQQRYLDTLEKLRIALNRSLFLGLMGFEGHFAVYPEGGFYKPHLDRHRETSDRIVTVILYLNPDWQPGNGGELKIWTLPGDREGEFAVVEPRMGTLVCFLARDHWHEVLPAGKTRASITGWFRGAGGNS